MKVIIISIVCTLMIAVASGINVNLAVHHYNQLNCNVTQIKNGQLLYKCEDINEKEGCYHNGDWYKNGQILNNTSTDPCVQNCVCLDNEWDCAYVECPYDFDASIENKQCYVKNQCCAEDCKEDPDVLNTCVVGGKEYKVGQYFYPETDFNQCTKCICNIGFNGTLTEEYCEKFTCDLYVHYSNRFKEGCVPIYFNQNDCCPTSMWRCPSADDKSVGDPLLKASGSECIFGSLKLSVGQRLLPTKSDKCINCECLIPPQLTCAVDLNCYYNEAN